MHSLTSRCSLSVLVTLLLAVTASAYPELAFSDGARKGAREYVYANPSYYSKASSVHSTASSAAAVLPFAGTVVQPPPIPKTTAGVSAPPKLPFVPPDVPPPPYPPFPPPLAEPYVGHIRNLADVCRVCTAHTYSPSCYSPFASYCLRAINVYRQLVLQVPDRICLCYGAIATQLLTSCPALNPSVSFLGNCDFYCFYGPRCSFTPVLYSLVSPGNVVTGNGSTAAPSGSSGAVQIDFMPTLNAGNTVAFSLHFSTGTPASKILAASIRSSTTGSEGPVTLPVISSPQSISSASTVSVAAPMALMQQISIAPYNYYLQIDTDKGSLRGQLVINAHLFSVATADAVPVPCADTAGPGCTAIADLAFSSFAVYYTFTYGSSVQSVVSAGVYQGLPGSPGTLIFPFFGPLIAPPSTYNAITPPIASLLTVLTNPTNHYLSLSTPAHTTGALRGQLRETIAVTALLSSSQVVPSAFLPGSGLFDAVVGGGALCYTFSLSPDVPNASSNGYYAYLHQGTAGKRGGIVIFLTLAVQPYQRICVGVDTDTTALIGLSPANYYVQLYSNSQPLGAYRGQLTYNPNQS